MMIDIHLQEFKISVNQLTKFVVVWSRGKNKAQTRYKTLDQDIISVNFDEKFNIGTSVYLDPETDLPAK